MTRQQPPVLRVLARLGKVAGGSLGMPTHRHALLWWVLTRAVLFGFWGLLGMHIQGDVIYYHESMRYLFHGAPPGDVLVEYPTPLLWLLAIPYILGGGTLTGYVIAFVTLFVAADALMGYVLWRSARQYGTNPRPAVAFWIWFVVVMGPITYMRLDLLTAALSAAGLVAILRHHRPVSGVMIGIGAAIKLWPALLWPAAMVDKKAVRQATAGFAITGGVLALASLIYGGWNRLVSPLSWQSERGLQIESLYATPLMVLHLFRPSSYPIYNSPFNSYEIIGPGAAELTRAASMATAVGGVIMVALFIGWLRRLDRTPIEAGTLMVVATLIMIITNKAFSPQYMIWLAGPVAGLLTISARHPDQLPDNGHLFTWFHPPRHLKRDDHLVGPLKLARHVAIWVIVLTITTQLIYPVFYIYYVKDGFWTPLAVTILAARNLVLLYFSVRLIVFTVRNVSFPRHPAGETVTPPDEREPA